MVPVPFDASGIYVYSYSYDCHVHAYLAEGLLVCRWQVNKQPAPERFVTTLQDRKKPAINVPGPLSPEFGIRR